MKKKKVLKTKPRPREEERGPVLRFTPTAWAKLIWFRDHGDTEIGGFGIAAPVSGAESENSRSQDDPLLIREFVTVTQKVSAVSVAFDDEAVADFFEQQVDMGRKPARFSRIWLHSHPGNSAMPSGTDEETFDRVFGGCDWAVMFIVAQNGETYARLRFNVGPGGETVLPVEVDYSVPFDASAHEAWEQEYNANIEPEPLSHDLLGTICFGDDRLELLEDEEFELLAGVDGLDRLLEGGES